MTTLLKVPVTSEDQIQGPEDARITLVEYGDFECPYCKRSYQVVKALQKQFGNQLRFIFRNFPLKEIHPEAEMAAEAAEFAAAHHRFWEMHDLIYENQEKLNLPFVVTLAEQLQLPKVELEQALQNKTYLPKIQNDFLGGVRSGVNGTPTFFVNDQRFDGPFERLDKVVTAVLNQ